MNYSTAIFLINDKARAVHGTYEVDTQTTKAPRELFKTLDQSIKVGDLALVQSGTRHGVTVVKITDLDVEFDIETTTKIGWVICKVDMSTFQDMANAEQDAIRVIQQAEKNRKRAELKKTLMADVEGELSGMTIAAIGHDPVPAESVAGA